MRFRNLQYAAALLLLAAPARAAENTTLHCFAWTAKPEATAADWEAFAKASDEVPRKIKGVVRVWYGKLQNPLGQVSISGMENTDFRKFNAGERVTSPVTRLWRQYAMCIEMTGPDALKAYDADPYHQTWAAAYEKVRVEGTTTFDMLAGHLR